MEDEIKDLKYVRGKIEENLSIEEVARNLLGEPSSENRNAKWNMTYKSIYKEENTPSFKISTRLNVFHCFATNNTGGVVKLYHDFKSLNGIPISYEQACKDLIRDYELSIKMNSVPQKTRNKKFNEIEKNIIKFFQLIVEFSHYYLKSGNCQKVEDYLIKERMISEEAIDFFNLGYFDAKHNSSIDTIINKISGLTKDDLKRYGILKESGNFSLSNRIIIPKYDVNGEVVSLCGRSPNKDASSRYLRLENNSLYKDDCPELESNKYLYNFDRAKNFIVAESEVIIVEGYFDVIRLYEKGIYNVVALETTSMTENQEKQLETLGPIKITSFLDADESGKNMQIKLLDKLSNKKKRNQFFYPKTFFINDESYNEFGKDPDEYLKTLNKEKVDELLLNKVNYRNNFIEEHIDSFEKNPTYTFKELYEDIGYLLNHYNSTYNSRIEQIIKNSKGEELEEFHDRIKYVNDFEKIYLMNYLNAEDFYCENLLNNMKEFVNNYKIYNDFMIEILDIMQSVYKVEKKDSRIKDVGIFYSTEKKNLRTYGDKKSKIIVEAFDEFNTYISIELDYYKNYLVVLNRLNNEGTDEKRKEENFFDHKLFREIYKEKNREKALKYIRDVFVGE